MKANHIMLLTALFVAKLCAANTPAITIRPVALADFDAIREMNIRIYTPIFGKYYSAYKLRKIYTSIFDQEAADMQTLGDDFIGFVACTPDSTIIGYFSAQRMLEMPNALYDRWSCVDTPFQKQGIGTQLLATILAARPLTERYFTITISGQQHALSPFISHGGVEVSIDICAPYLQNALGKNHFTGVMFDRTAINQQINKHIAA